MQNKYEVIAEHDGVKFEIVTSDRVGIFGEPIIQACTFQKVLRPAMERRTLGTYSTRAEACKRIKDELSNRQNQ